MEVARDGTGRTLRIAATACGYRWDVHDRFSPWEREAPTTPFGRLLADACRGIVGEMIARTECDFMNGGCGMLAQALSDWSGGALRTAIVLYRGTPDHVVATDGTTFLDSDGQFDGTGFLEKSLVLDDDRDVRILPDRIWNAAATGIREDAAVTAWIAAEMAARLPAPEGGPWRVSIENRT